MQINKVDGVEVWIYGDLKGLLRDFSTRNLILANMKIFEFLICLS